MTQKRSKLPFHLNQSILIPKTHGEVKKHGAAGARTVAKRFGFRPSEVVEVKNHYEARQIDPSLIKKGSIVTQNIMGGIVKIRRGVLKPSIAHAQLEMTGGKCSPPSGKKRLTCTEHYQAGPLKVSVRTSREEHAKMPETTNVHRLIDRLGKSRLEVSTPKHASESKILKRY